MEHRQHDINYYRRTAQSALNRRMLEFVSKLINLISWYGGKDAEEIYEQIKGTLEDEFPNKGS